jgi:hypothetical protein
MKFFTQNLLERFGSEDDRVALAAQEELEKRSEEYRRHLREIEAELPPRFREMQERYYLHDARFQLPFLEWPPDLPFWDHPELAAFLLKKAFLPAESWPSVEMTLQLDPPPKEFLILHYRFVKVEETHHARQGREESCPFLEWQYDEIDLASSDQGIEFNHSILFTNGFELRLRFLDFDFAILKPMCDPPERKRISRGKVSS